MDVSAAVASLPPSRGFAIEVIGERMESKYTCSFCGYILRQPVQSYCGHRFCTGCVEYLEKQEDVKLCPSCVKEHPNPDPEESQLTMTRIFPDNATKKELYKLPAVCPNEGCSWTGILKEYEKHERSCQFRVEHCICGEKFAPGVFQEHLEKFCPDRLVECQYCSKIYPYKNESAHLVLCPKLPVTCHRCHTEGIPRNAMPDHLQAPQCIPRIRCPYKCGHLIEEASLEIHAATYTKPHLDAIFEGLETLNMRLDQGLTGLNEKVEALDAGAVGGTEKRDEENMETNQNQVISMEAEIRRNEVFESALIVLKREIEKVQKKTEDLISQRQTDSDRIATLERKVQGLSLHTAPPPTLEELPCYGGSLIWAISNVSQKREEAIHGTTPGLTSVPFYTSKTGYKLCGRIYLNGDGMGRGTHLSVFIVVMKGKHDSLLKWPFRQKVTMTLLDQSANRKHLTDAFRPDPSSASFQRPRSEMNTASGCPMFTPLMDIFQENPSRGDPQFLADDTLFIKFHVDTNGLQEL